MRKIVTTGVAAVLALVASVTIAPTANADARYEPPAPDFVLAQQLVYKDKKSREFKCLKDNGYEGYVYCVNDPPATVTMQQWVSEAQDLILLRVFSTGRNIGNPEEYRRTYRGSKVIKPRPPMRSWVWDQGCPNGIDSCGYYLKTVVDLFDGPEHDGFDMTFKRPEFKAGNYTILFTDRDFTPAQWKCSIYYKEVCKWSSGSDIVYWDAVTFDVKSQNISKLRTQGTAALSPKDFKKDMDKLLKPKKKKKK